MSKKFYVETYRPAFPEKGVRYRVHSEKAFSRDILSPCMTAVFEVDCCETKEQAIALVIERASGINVTVRRIFGGKDLPQSARVVNAMAIAYSRLHLLRLRDAIQDADFDDMLKVLYESLPEITKKQVPSLPPSC